jgi:adenylate kinase family enzyme
MTWRKKQAYALRGTAVTGALAARLSEITGLRVIELDKIFWRPGLVATPHEKWLEIQQRFVEENGWIMDGAWGPLTLS